MILAPLVLSSIGSLIFAFWPWCLGLGSLALVGWPRHLVCGLLLSAFRPGLSVFGVSSWALCGWFSGPDFSVLAPWPWLFGPGLVVSASWPLFSYSDFSGLGSGILALSGLSRLILALWSWSPDSDPLVWLFWPWLTDLAFLILTFWSGFSDFWSVSGLGSLWVGWPWFIGVDALTSALRLWLSDGMLSSPGFWSLVLFGLDCPISVFLSWSDGLGILSGLCSQLSVSLVWVSDLGSPGLCSAGAVRG